MSYKKLDSYKFPVTKRKQKLYKVSETPLISKIHYQVVD